jgi:molybdopterin-guanine dinucleotide biosynthesis protein A
MNEKVELAAILTGGAAKRMGGRKADLPVGGVPMTELVRERVAPFAHEIVCVGHINPLEHLGINALPDLYPVKASLGGIATALNYALQHKGSDSWVLAVGCDMPVIQPELLELLLSRRSGCDIVMPLTDFGPEPLCALYRAGIFDTIKDQITQGNMRILNLLDTAKVHRLNEAAIRQVDPEFTSFINVNRPGDLERVELLLSSSDLQSNHLKESAMPLKSMSDFA